MGIWDGRAGKVSLETPNRNGMNSVRWVMPRATPCSDGGWTWRTTNSASSSFFFGKAPESQESTSGIFGQPRHWRITQWKIF